MEIENILLEYTIPEIRDLILEYAYRCEARSHEPGYCRWCMKFITVGEYELSIEVEYKSVYIDDKNKCHHGYTKDIILPPEEYESTSYDYMGYVEYPELEKIYEYVGNSCDYCDNCNKDFTPMSARIVYNNGDILNSDSNYEFDRKYECFKAIQYQRTKDDS